MTEQQFAVIEQEGILEVVKTNEDVNEGSEYCLTEEEYHKLVNSAKTLQDRCIINLFLRCGLRRAEVKNLKIEHVDTTHANLNLEFTKRMKRRTVPIPPEVLQDLKLLIAGRTTGYLFLSNWEKKTKAPLSLAALNRITAEAGLKAKIRNPNPKLKKINPHLLRHTFARHFLKNGGRMEVLQKILGHSNIQTTINVYGKPSLGDIKEQFDKYGI